ncbi:hypothetical protein TBLA_0E02352 [Henningerozyma blattae CBS 6284]|uniref:Uncharacterized protein n=1 Tax=Henningerozyma blattae (strain ATCC 34711 / CBS 6284 / DSM 70876 / NBRC 10599 / NRRL Y-10934 / UCD 77-7) TaxID=1071380 RepID=I2H4I7_HENB6|nr:hypothetical protein TBLA_0E02352 [Tetrapisispora blattae CBS 6284]CCH61289.1 hypothetical protein TBLA_0E02352 [Tetrapisispora blattae CBS 6284]
MSYMALTVEGSTLLISPLISMRMNTLMILQRTQVPPTFQSNIDNTTNSNSNAFSPQTYFNPMTMLQFMQMMQSMSINQDTIPFAQPPNFLSSTITNSFINTPDFVYTSDSYDTKDIPSVLNDNFDNISHSTSKIHSSGDVNNKVCLYRINGKTEFEP